MTIVLVWTLISLVGFIAAVAFLLDAYANGRAAARALRSAIGRHNRTLLSDAITVARYQTACGALSLLALLFSLAVGITVYLPHHGSHFIAWALVASNACISGSLLVQWAMRHAILHEDRR